MLDSREIITSETSIFWDRLCELRADDFTNMKSLLNEASKFTYEIIQFYEKKNELDEWEKACLYRAIQWLHDANLAQCLKWVEIANDLSDKKKEINNKNRNLRRGEFDGLDEEKLRSYVLEASSAAAKKMEKLNLL